MKSVGIIPARYASTRLPGKPLKDICGKPMIQHVYERAQKAKRLDEIIVATDDQRIIDVVKGFGGKAVLTSVNHPNGSSRAAEVVAKLDFELIINIQGDEPLLSISHIDGIIEYLPSTA